MQSSSIPAKFPIPFANSAVAPYIRPIPVLSQVSVTPGAASLTDGFPQDTFQPEATGGIPPSGQDFNGLLNQITLWTQWANAAAQVFFDSAFATAIGGYPKGATVLSTTFNYWWKSSIENNSNNPDTGGAGWVQVVPTVPSTTTPLMDNVAAIGSLLTFARGDHVHPTDTSRSALSYVNSTFETITAAAATFATLLNPTTTGTATHTGPQQQNGDLTVVRPGTNTGAILLGNTGGRYLMYDGNNYFLAGTDLIVNNLSFTTAYNTAQAANTTANTANGTANTALTNANAALANFANFLPNIQNSNSAQRGYLYGWNTQGSITLPAGGTFAWYHVYFDGGGRALNGGFFITAGGTLLFNFGGAATSFGWAIRLT